MQANQISIKSTEFYNSISIGLIGMLISKSLSEWIWCRRYGLETIVKTVFITLSVIIWAFYLVRNWRAYYNFKNRKVTRHYTMRLISNFPIWKLRSVAMIIYNAYLLHLLKKIISMVKIWDIVWIQTTTSLQIVVIHI